MKKLCQLRIATFCVRPNQAALSLLLVDHWVDIAVLARHPQLLKVIFQDLSRDPRLAHQVFKN